MCMSTLNTDHHMSSDRRKELVYTSRFVRVIRDSEDPSEKAQDRDNCTRRNIVRKADLSKKKKTLIFVCKMCVFVSHPMKIVTFPKKNGDLFKNWLLIFLRERNFFKTNHGNR